MSKPDKDSFDMSELDSSLPAAAAALSAEDRAGLVNALKDKLQNLAGQHADVMETLSPKVRKRVEALREIQLTYRQSFISGKGVPEFWLTAMKTNDILSEEVDICKHYFLLHVQIYLDLKALRTSLFRSQSVMKRL
ncbi:UNVERIFIED_CONTAM: Nucleosome assembly protein 1 [Sesamum angustifolium]|uniref:Nucleosome assembly protein 1 n=1 Tax=Sesamum angustifolium TaxID=2727405 RepID=A0AAW2LJE6_9LAMI